MASEEQGGSQAGQEGEQAAAPAVGSPAAAGSPAEEGADAEMEDAQVAGRPPSCGKARARAKVGRAKGMSVRCGSSRVKGEVAGLPQSRANLQVCCQGVLW